MSPKEKSLKPTKKTESKKPLTKTPTSSKRRKDELDDEQLERISGGAMSYHTEV